MGKSSKHEKKKHKHKERKEKKISKKLKKHSKDKHHKAKQRDEADLPSVKRDSIAAENDNEDFAIPVELMNSKSHAPETPEEYQQRQNRIRTEIDPVTGRSRLIKGDGEVLEELVSKERHKSINKEATKGDGEHFQETTLGKLF